jgi:hypothetical protein
MARFDKIFLGMIVQVLRQERSKDNKQKGKKEWVEPYQTTPNSHLPNP